MFLFAMQAEILQKIKTELFKEPVCHCLNPTTDIST